MLRLGPALALALGVSAFGEFVGYVLGRGKTDHLYDMELHKVRYVAASGAGRRGRQEPLAALTRWKRSAR